MTRHQDRTSDRLARAGITEREAEMLLAVTEWRRNPEIAAGLHVSVRTVESHVAALMRKLGVTDRRALIETGLQMRRAVRTTTRRTQSLAGDTVRGRLALVSRRRWHCRRCGVHG
jgi:DNA-binding CsgD family transcriptional regulator